jgi:hypothetical protein
VEERAARATPGPWQGVVDDHGHGRVESSVWADSIHRYVAESITSGERHQADAAWIALMSPDRAAPLAALFRHHAGAVRWASTVGEVDRSSGVIDLALQILGENT